MTQDRGRAAVILTHNRPELLAECITAIGPQVDVVIVIDNASIPPASIQTGQSWHTILIPIPDQPPNISRMWNVGIDAAMAVYTGPESAHIAVLCDDTAVPPGWFDAIVEAMTQTGAVVGCSDPHGTLQGVRVKIEPDSNLGERMPGHAWVLDPTSPVRPDETLPWWWGDTDVDWQARKAGGMVMIGGYFVSNIRPNENLLRPELAAQSGQDGLTFTAKWGWRPW